MAWKTEESCKLEGTWGWYITNVLFGGVGCERCDEMGWHGMAWSVMLLSNDCFTVFCMVHGIRQCFSFPSLSISLFASLSHTHSHNEKRKHGMSSQPVVLEHVIINEMIHITCALMDWIRCVWLSAPVMAFCTSFSMSMSCFLHIMYGRDLLLPYSSTARYEK